MLEFRAGRALRAPHTTVRTDAPVSPVREFAPHPREMGAYKRSPTWSKEGDRERDAAVRAQWRKLSKDPATLTRACAPARSPARPLRRPGMASICSSALYASAFV